MKDEQETICCPSNGDIAQFQSFSNTSRLHLCRTLPDFNWHARVARSLSDSWASCIDELSNSLGPRFTALSCMAARQLLGAHKCSSSYHNYIVIPDDMKLYTHCTDCECMDGLLHLEGTCQFPLLCTNCNSHSSTASLLVCIAMQCLHSPAT